MRCILNQTLDPAFNLAAEEWLFRHWHTDIFMLWRNGPSVIVGRNQNTAVEINQDFVRANNIKVVRRLTGGGAVFHDLGNINFTFIKVGQQSRQLDFARFTTPILQALRALGVACEFSGRNDLTIGGQKFSGNAQFLEKDRVLHHGTLLFSAQMQDLSAALRINTAKYAGRAVQSVASRVTNIASHLPQPMSVEEFMDHLMAQAVPNSAESKAVSDGFRPEETQKILALAQAKYATWEWNFGKSPAYGFTRTTRTPGGLIEVHLDIGQGVIQAVKIFGDFFGLRPVDELSNSLIGCAHSEEALSVRLQDLDIDDYIRGVDLPTLLRSLL